MTHGKIDYLQLPALDIARSAAFYEKVFGWKVELDYASFEAPGMIGQWTTERAPVDAGGPLVWIRADNLYPTLEVVADAGGRVHGRPRPDGGERWLVEIDDPAGNRIGVVVHVRSPRSQTLVAVRDVEASSRWYQQLLGLRSDHGGPHYERLLSGAELVLQLHSFAVEHHHGRIGDPNAAPGNGVVLWFGDVADFDDVVARAAELGAPVIHAPHRNPPTGEGNGPGHREIWVSDPDGYTVVVASPDGEAFEPA
ncbi:MAG: VOC family protein [Pseudonocardiales bacterium]|nr:VOC family protein [Pseudonocardiales bacterium]